MKWCGNMLKKKMLRDILKQKSQFITIIIMIAIGIMVYSGINAYMLGMQRAADNFYQDYNLQDLNVLGSSFKKSDLETVKKINNVNDAELKMALNMNDADNDTKSYLVSAIESNNISKFYVADGALFDKDKKGIWLDYFYAEANNLKVGDTISFKYEDYTFKEEILGIIYIPDHVYDVKDATQLMPNHDDYGIVYISSKELEGFIKNNIKTSLSDSLNIEVTDKIFNKYYPDFNYEEYIPYNYMMIDVNDKANNNQVKDDIEKEITNAYASVSIEDTLSYTMYQGEINEGKAYVGIFSGLFLFIALLSVITTMRRVVNKQKLQIGTLKALGFSKLKITSHYVNYGLFTSLLGCLIGILLGRFFLGSLFLGMEMSFFEIPNGKVFIEAKTYLMVLMVILAVCFVVFITCFQELKKKPAESLRNEIPKVKRGSLDITTKGLFKKLNFAAKWNIRDILRNKIRTITGIIGIAGCSTLIVCALGMLNSMNYFIKLQFDILDNFKYKLTLKSDITPEAISDIKNTYGDNSSSTLTIEIKDDNDNRKTNSLFVDNSNSYIRFIDEKYNYINLDNNDGVYVTYKYANTNNIKIGDTIKWHIYGKKDYYTSKVVGYYRDPQVQGLTCTKEYLESLDLEYSPDAMYTDKDLSAVKMIKDVDIIQDKNELKNAISSMLSMTREMITIIIVFAIILGMVIIYNTSILSFTEKEYQFATLKVLGFNEKKIKKIFSLQNSIICVISIILGLPLGYYLTNYLFKVCLDENYDFGVHIEISTFVIAAIGTYLVSLVVSKALGKKVDTIDMVSSLKANE